MDPVRNAERDILRYLIAHQDARDTVEGIQQWWLPPDKHYGVADISAALLRLEEKNLVRVWRSAFAQPVYGRYSPDAAPLEHHLRTLD